jgi:hypothetical protein
MAYSDRHLFVSANLDLTAIQDNFLFTALNRVTIHRVGIMIMTAGSSGLVTVTFQKTVGGTAGTDTTIKALIVSDALHAVGKVVYGEPATAPFVLEPGDHVNLLVPAETSGTAPAVTRAIIEYSINDESLAGATNLIATT